MNKLKRYVIVDIDGTVAKVSSERLKHLKQDEPDWDTFYELCFNDKPIAEMIELVNYLFLHYDVAFCTGRREAVRDKTLTWLENNLAFSPKYTTLLMRPNGDLRHDTEVKPELLANSGIKLEDIAFVLEDRASMVEKWREMGLRCLQVDKGNF